MAAPGNPSVKRPKRLLVTVLAGLAATWLLLTAGLYAAMTRPPDEFGRIMKHVPFPLMIVLPFETLWNQARAGAIHVGETAPDFQLPLLDHSATVRLSSLRGSRPVVLVFGSYT
jgi:hypothetical protein